MRKAEDLAMRITAVLILVFTLLPAAYGQQPQSAPPPDVIRTSAGNLRVERLATLEFPWGTALLPDGRVLITEKPGRLRIWVNARRSDPSSHANERTAETWRQCGGTRKFGDGV